MLKREIFDLQYLAQHSPDAANDLQKEIRQLESRDPTEDLHIPDVMDRMAALLFAKENKLDAIRRFKIVYRRLRHRSVVMGDSAAADECLEFFLAVLRRLEEIGETEEMPNICAAMLDVDRRIHAILSNTGDL